ncbi:MAG: ABC transporter permease subunit, partial [Chloroflexi bacterium]|nr:ABC transporter permease subunit [Chloroflexota bacterium]
MAVLDFLVQQRVLIMKLLGEHLVLTFVAVGIAAAIALPFGILVTRARALNFIVVGAANLSQTIPSLAVLGLCIPFLGIGILPVLVALVLRAMLPIVVNTYVGIEGLERSLIESARGMGMRDLQI